MVDINKEHGFYGTVKCSFDEQATKNIWDVMVKRLVELYPEKTENDILDFLNGRAGRHLADRLLDVPEPGMLGLVLMKIAMLHKLKLAEFWDFHTDNTVKQQPIDKRLLYKAAIHYEMRKPNVQELIRKIIGCDNNTVYDTPGKWINSEYTTIKELETMWGYIQERLTKRHKHGND
ncbi:MAG: hypothetical protein IKP24_00650 [Alphaproteobacteria bacterium]|nr:hypothetical protein [Alphaproteobacteria bacterium]